MSRANVDAVRSAYDGWATGDFMAGPNLIDPEIVFILRPEFPDAGVYHGREELRTYMQRFLSSWVNLTITPEEFIDAEGSVVAAVHQRGVGREGGSPTELHCFQVWTFRGPTAIRLEGIRDRADALAVVGLP